MGAEFNYYVYKGDKNKLEKHHAAEQQDQCQQYGNDTYAGHLGIMPAGIEYAKVEPLNSASEAREYLEENHCKWDCAMAIAFKDEGKAYNKASQKVLEQREKLKLDLKKLGHDLLMEICGTKSKTIGCKNCGSSIARNYLLSPNCPICGKLEALYSLTQAQKLERKRQKLRELNSKPLTKTKGQVTCYIVGGWCAS